MALLLWPRVTDAEGARKSVNVISVHLFTPYLRTCKSYMVWLERLVEVKVVSIVGRPYVRSDNACGL